jgi:AraC family transcriptional regulator
MIWVTPPTTQVPYGNSNPFARSAWEGSIGKIFLLHHPGETIYPPHSNEAAMFVYVCSGGYQKSMRGAEFDYQPGTLHYTPPETPIRRITMGSPVVSIMIDLNPGWQDEEALRLRSLMKPGEPLTEVMAFRHFSAAIGNLMQSAQHPDLVDSIIFDTLSILPGSHEQKPKNIAWLRQAYDLIRSDPSASHKVYRIAREVGIDRIHLGRTFRRVYGISVGEYIREQRLNKAWQMLLGEDLSLGEIAQKTGFVDQAQFSRAFRDRFGSPPSRFRRDVLEASWPYTPKTGKWAAIN